MPLYTIHCDKCRTEMDVFRKLSEIELLPVCCGAKMQRKVCAPAVIGDLQPYQAMGVDVATGTAPMITSRSRHREYLKRNGYVEVGNEMPKQRQGVEGDFNVRAELKQAVRKVLPKYQR